MSQPPRHPYGAPPVHMNTEPFYSRPSMNRDAASFPTDNHPPPSKGPSGGAFRDTSTAFPGRAQTKHNQQPPPQARQPPPQARQPPPQSHQRHSSQPPPRSQPVHQSAAAPSKDLGQSQARMAVGQETSATQEYNTKGNLGNPQPLRPALKKSLVPVYAEEPIRIKQQPEDDDYHNQRYDHPAMPHQSSQANAEFDQAYSDCGAGTPYSASQPVQGGDSNRHQQKYHGIPNRVQPDDLRRLRRQASMPAPSTASMEQPSFPSESEERQFPQPSTQPTIASSITKGRGQLYDPTPLEEDPWASPTNKIGLSVEEADRSLAEHLASAKDEYDKMRIKEYWYPETLKARDREIARLHREINEQIQARQTAENIRDKTIAGAASFAEKFKRTLKQKDDEQIQMNQVTEERHQALSKFLDERVEEMRNFKKDHDLASINNALENVTSTFSNIRTSLNEVKNEIAENNKGSADQLKVAKEDIIKLKSTVEDQASTIVKLETKIEHYEAAIAPALQKLDGNLAELKKDNEADQPALGNLVNKNIELSDNLSAVEKSFSKSLGLNESYQTTIDECSDILREHGCEGDDYKTMLKDLVENHANELKEQKDELNKKLEYEIAKARAGANLVEENHNKLTKAQKEAEASQILIKELKDKLKNMEVTIATMETDKARSEERYHNCTLQLQEAKQSLKDVEEAPRKKIVEAVKQSATQSHDQIKSVLEMCKTLSEQVLTLGGSGTASDAGQKLMQTQDELRSCQQALDLKTAELNTLKETSNSEEDGAAAIKRYKAGGFTNGEVGLVTWARNGEQQDLQRKENAWKNNIKSLTSEVNKLKKELEEKNKQISLPHNDGETSQAAPATSSSKTVKFDEAPRSILTASKSEILRPSVVNPSRSSKKRPIDIPETSEDEYISSRPPASQKRAKYLGAQKRLAEEDDDSYHDEFPALNEEDLQIAEALAGFENQLNSQKEGSASSQGGPKTTDNEDTNEVSSDLSDMEDDKDQRGSVPSSQGGQHKSRASASASQPAQAKQQRRPAPANSQKAKSKSKKGNDSDDDYQESKTKKTDKKRK